MSIIVGFILILIGINILFDNLGLFNLTGFAFKLWPLILVYFGVTKLIKGKMTWGLILSFLGIITLIGNFSAFKSWNLFSLWPLIIVVAGVSVLIKSITTKEEVLEKELNEDEDEEIKDNEMNVFSFFSSTKKNVESKKFLGGSVVSIFGGTELNFTDVTVGKKNAVIEVVSIFGENKLFVKPGTNIVMESVPVFGAIEDKRKDTEMKEGNKIYIKAVAVFGSVSIHNL